ncbi:nuclear transport factor 2 family protein [Actinophytocola sp.]|uniref:nuclear transport factor 2 family protein n=1 Tax=Actinophytocola sp. TaxID=1872138 RepID=UPI0025BE1CD4|nr:nuclear transport factor 2 family protein [Actinophytocola sp.]
MALTHKEIFEKYVYAGAITRNVDAIAEMFTEDGIFEAPLVPDGHPLPRRLVGRDAIRAGIGAYHREPAHHGTVNVEESTYMLHDTAEPDVFVAEIDTVLEGTAGQRTPMSLVQIFRIRNGQIAMLRDYFTVPSSAAADRAQAWPTRRERPARHSATAAAVVDSAIIRDVQEDARRPDQDIARKVGIAPSTCLERTRLLRLGLVGPPLLLAALAVRFVRRGVALGRLATGSAGRRAPRSGAAP